MAKYKFVTMELIKKYELSYKDEYNGELSVAISEQELSMGFYIGLKFTDDNITPMFYGDGGTAYIKYYKPLFDFLSELSDLVIR